MSLKIAIQKSGRLYEESIKLLKKSGLNIDNGKGQLIAPIKGIDAKVYFLRNSDIPKYLSDGLVDVAIIGENILLEKESKVEILQRLGFSNCRLSIATPKNDRFDSLKDLEGKKIATSYPVSLKNYLKRNNVNSEIHTISGSVEIAPNMGLADAICDIVSSGSTLYKNGLEEREIVLSSEAVLAVNLNAIIEKSGLVQELNTRVQSVVKANENKYILFNIPNDKIAKVSELLPSMRSPSILPLGTKGWSSMHTVINQSDFWNVIYKLRKEGAEGILVAPIDNMII